MSKLETVNQRLRQELLALELVDRSLSKTREEYITILDRYDVYSGRPFYTYTVAAFLFYRLGYRFELGSSTIYLSHAQLVCKFTF